MRIKIIAVGNVLRGDDGAGSAVLEALRGRLPDAVEQVEASGEGATLMGMWRDTDAVFVIDAVRSQGEAGTIHRIDASSQRVSSDFFHYSTHAFSVAEAVEMARTLGELPAHVVLYGIEGESFETGGELTPAVRKAVPEVARLISVEVEELGQSVGYHTNPPARSI